MTTNTNTNKRAGGNFFSKSINMQTQIRPCRGDFFLKINKRACTSIRYTRVLQTFHFYLDFLYRILQIATFTHSFLHILFPWQVKPFASSPQNSVKIHWVEWMGLNFDE